MEDYKPGMKIRRKADEAEVPAVAADPVEAPASTPPQPIAVAPAEAAPQAPVSAAPAARAAEATPAHEPRRDPSPPDQKIPTTDDFAAMFGATNTTVAHFDNGQRVKARIVSIARGTIFVSLGAKTEGTIDASEFVDDDGTITVKVGDEVESFVVNTRGGIKLSTALGKNIKSVEMLEEAKNQGIPVEGKVLSHNKGGFEIQLPGVKGFCPFSQIDFESGGEPEKHVGQSYRFLITRIEEGGRNVVVSRTQLIRDERRRAADETMSKIEEGSELDGTVTRITEFGAFVDLGGIEGMVHVSELGWSRVANPADVLSMGATVRVRILRIEDSVTKDGRPSKRIKLSMKAATNDPWLDAIAAFSIGSTYSGTVAKLEKFGAFVEIAPGIDGLVHISEMAVGRRIHHPSEVVAVGDRVQVQVVDVDPRKRQIALSMKALAEDPWAGVSAAFPVGARIQGTVESIQSFGLFVTLPNGITGLIPMSQLAEGEDKSVHAKFAAGSAIEAMVLAVEPERRRLTLTRRSDQDAESEAALKAYQSSKQGEPARLGTFADLLAGKTRG